MGKFCPISKSKKIIIVSTILASSIVLSFGSAFALYEKNPDQIDITIKHGLMAYYYLQDSTGNKYTMDGISTASYSGEITVPYNTSLTVYHSDAPSVVLASFTSELDAKYNNFSYTPATSTLTKTMTSRRIYVTNSASVRKTWNSFYIYPYSDSGEHLYAWPGNLLSSSETISSKLCFYSDYIDVKYDNVVFCNGSSDSSDTFLKTADLKNISSSTPVYQFLSNKEGNWTALDSAVSSTESASYDLYLAGIGDNWNERSEYGIEFNSNQGLFKLTLNANDEFKFRTSSTWYGYDYCYNDKKYLFDNSDGNCKVKTSGTYFFYIKSGGYFDVTKE